MQVLPRRVGLPQAPGRVNQIFQSVRVGSACIPNLQFVGKGENRFVRVTIDLPTSYRSRVWSLGAANDTAHSGHILRGSLLRVSNNSWLYSNGPLHPFVYELVLEYLRGEYSSINTTAYDNTGKHTLQDAGFPTCCNRLPSGKVLKNLRALVFGDFGSGGCVD